MRFQSRFLNKASHGKFWSSWSHPVKSGRLDPLCYWRSVWRSQDWRQSWSQRVDWKPTGSWCLDFWRGFITFLFPEQWFLAASPALPLLRTCCYSGIVPWRREDLTLTVPLWGLDKMPGMKRMIKTHSCMHTHAHIHRKKDECLSLSSPCKGDDFYLVFTYSLALQGWLSFVLFQIGFNF